MSSIKIAVVNSSSFGKIFPEHLARLKKIGEVQHFTFPMDIDGVELARELKGYQYIISSVTPFFDEAFFDNQHDVRLISRHGIGYNNINIPKATEKGVVVSIVSGLVEQEAVAENAVALLMAVLRQVVPAAKAVKESNWKERARFIGNEIKGKTVGVIGLGNIGSRVAEILKYGFGAHILAHDPYIKQEILDKNIAERVGLDELLQRSDIISLNALVTQETYHLLKEREFGLLKEGVYITNSARGELMQQEALLKALDSGKIAGLGVDVVEGEPIDGNHPLLQHERVVVTPHTSAYTYECLCGMGDKVVTDVEQYHRGDYKAIKEVVNPKALEKL